MVATSRNGSVRGRRSIAAVSSPFHRSVRARAPLAPCHHRTARDRFIRKRSRMDRADCRALPSQPSPRAVAAISIDAAPLLAEVLRLQRPSIRLARRMADWRFGRAMRESRPSLSRSGAPPPAASLSLSSRDAHRPPLAPGTGMRGQQDARHVRRQPRRRWLRSWRDARPTSSTLPRLAFASAPVRGASAVFVTASVR